MEKIDIELFAKNIDQYLKDRYKYWRSGTLGYLSFNNIYIRLAKLDLMFRWNDYNSELVIARIYFKKTRNGNGTNLLKFITDQSYYFNYETVSFEMCNDNCSLFAKKFGFENSIMSPKNYAIHISKLRAQFTALPITSNN